MSSPSVISLYAVGIGLIYILRFTFVLFPLLRSEAHTSLSFPSNEFSGMRYWSLFFYFMARSTIRRIPLFSPPAIRESSSREADGKGHTSTIPGPRISLEIPFHCSAGDVVRYNRAAKTVGIDTPSHPLHLMLFLSAATEPAMLLLLSKSNCPVDPVGAVNVRNRFEIVNPDLLEERLREAIDVDTEQQMVVDQKWKLIARLDPNVKKVKKGWEIMIVIELITTTGEVLYRQLFTFLQFAKHTISVPVADPDPDERGTREKQETGTVKMVNKDPALWGELSKDYNPIHFSASIARLFGFRGKIAHGNHVLAKGLARLSGDIKVKGTTTMEVEFRRPVFVPSELDIKYTTVMAGGGEIILGSKGKEQVVARWR